MAVGRALGRLGATWPHRLLSSPWIFEPIQRLLGQGRTEAELKPFLVHAASKSVLDIGAGTSLTIPLLPVVGRYTWLDIDPRRIGPFRRRCRRAGLTDAHAVVGDATSLCLREKSVDFVLCMALSHHLDDAGFGAMLDDIVRVTRESLLFYDSVITDGSTVSALIRRYDRGQYARREETIDAMLERRFVVRDKASYKVYHRHIIRLCTPRG